MGGLPLLAYPVAAIVALMSLGGPPSAGDSLPLVLASRAFLLGALVYPLVYGGCVIAAMANRPASTSPMLAALPLLYLVGLVALLGLWAIAERR